MKLTQILAVTTFLALFGAGSALAGDGDPAAGKEKSTTCTACHGAEGISPSGLFPNLAGQYADYLAHSLRQYQSGDRNNAVMAGMAAPLSEQDILDLAAYYASREGLRNLR